MKIKFTLLGLLLVCVTVQLFGQSPQELFERGNQYYRVGNFQHAADQYDSIIQHGYQNADVYFNLGNANYRLERLSQAILAYERASRLRPHDPDIEHNLKLLYLKTIDRIEPVPELFLIQWIRIVGSLLSIEAVKVLFIAVWIVLFGSLTLLYLVLRPEIIRIIRFTLLASFIGICFMGSMMFIQSIQDTSGIEYSIITASTVTAKSSPDEKGVDAFVLHEGLKVKVTDAVSGWVKITLVDGKVGWIEVTQCEKI